MRAAWGALMRWKVAVKGMERSDRYCALAKNTERLWVTLGIGQPVHGAARVIASQAWCVEAAAVVMKITAGARARKRAARV